MPDTIKIPITATYRIIGGKPVMIDAEYAEISADAFARFLMERFGVQHGEAVI